MQTRFRLPILFFIAAFVMLTSCSKKTNKEGRYVPEKAAVVFVINGESISAKLPWEELKQTELFKNIDTSMKLDDYAKLAFDNPENTGIDTKKNVLMFFVKDSAGGYLAVEGSVKDAAKFKEFSIKTQKNSAETEKNGVHFITDSKLTRSWDKDKFVVVIDIPQMKTRNKFGLPNDPGSKRDVIGLATGIYELSEGNSLGADERFSELVSKPADMHFWVNVSSFTEDNPGMNVLSMTKMSDLYKDYCLTGIANFENGKITVDTKTYAGKQLSDLYKKYSGSKINTEMIKRIPAKDIAALIAISFKPEAVKEFAKLTGMDGLVNMTVANLGFTLDDCIKALKGDILFAVSDFKKDSLGKPAPNVLVAASVADKNSFGKLTEALNNMMRKANRGTNAGKDFSYNINDNYFVAGNDKASTDKFMNSANNSNYSFLDKVSGAASLFYVNVQSMLVSWNKEIPSDSLDNVMYQSAIKTWDNVIATGEGFKDGGSNSHIEINFIDKNTNGLKQLYNFIGTMTAIQKQKMHARDTWMNNGMGMPDSTTVVAPLSQ